MGVKAFLSSPTGIRLIALFFKMEDISTSTTSAESPITTDAMNPLWGFIEGG